MAHSGKRLGKSHGMPDHGAMVPTPAAPAGNTGPILPDFTGRWVLDRTEQLEEYMKQSLGTDHVKHKFPKDMTVVNEITQVGNNFQLKIITKGGVSETAFEVGEQWQEQDSTGDTCVVSSKWMNNKLVTIAEGRKTVTVTRELRGEFMITTMRCKNATSKCIFSREKH